MITKKQKLAKQKNVRYKSKINKFYEKLNQLKLAEEIISISEEYYNVDLTEDTHRAEVSRPRINAVFLCKKHAPKISLDHLGCLLGRSHCNFSVGIKRLKEQLPYDKERDLDLTILNLIIENKLKNK